jgi:hypothetical protein
MELVLGRFLLTLSIGLPIVLGVATAGSFLAIKGALAPVKKITINAESIAREDIDEISFSPIDLSARLSADPARWQ